LNQINSKSFEKFLSKSKRALFLLGPTHFSSPRPGHVFRVWPTPPSLFQAGPTRSDPLPCSCSARPTPASAAPGRCRPPGPLPCSSTWHPPALTGPHPRHFLLTAGPAPLPFPLLFPPFSASTPGSRRHLPPFHAEPTTQACMTPSSSQMKPIVHSGSPENPSRVRIGAATAVELLPPVSPICRPFPCRPPSESKLPFFLFMRKEHQEATVDGRRSATTLKFYRTTAPPRPHVAPPLR
jgi:hypothetical protein